MLWCTMYSRTTLSNCLSLMKMTWSRHSLRNVPTTRSATALAFGCGVPKPHPYLER